MNAAAQFLDPEESSSVREVGSGHYRILSRIASGGMASVYLGHRVGVEGFSRTVAIKKLHPAYAEDPEFVDMLLDEARIAARIRHPNVVATLDVERSGRDVALIMEYVEGAPLSHLMRSAAQMQCLPSPAIATGIIVQVLQGLHAAHEACGEDGLPMQIVHRDVSPQNIMLGTEGIVRVVDFGIAKAASRVSSTRGGQVKGKLRYLSPEQVSGQPVDRRSDLFSTAIVLWECLTGRRLFDGQSPGEIMARILADDVPSPARFAKVSSELGRVVLRALSYAADERFVTARDMARALALAEPPASTIEIGAWVERVSGQVLKERAQGVARAEQSGFTDSTPSRPCVVPSPEHSLRAMLRQSSGGPANEADDAEVHEWTARTARARTQRLALLGSVAALLVIVTVVLVAALSGSSSTVVSRTTFGRATSLSAVLTPKVEPKTTPARHRQGATRATSDSTRSARAERRAEACSPPYYLDADGNKRFRRECF
ncbi:MAG: serine/threonine-protein kinase [Polyangiaceae bacterium]